MRRTHRPSARSRHWTSLFICFALIISSLLLIVPVSSESGLPQNGSGQSNNQNVKKVTPRPPQPGAPALAMPNLDAARRARNDEPKAPREIQSNVRSRRKPLEPRRGLKVGDPLPRKTRVSADGFGDGSERVSIASAERRGAVGTATLNHARAARSLPAGMRRSVSLLSFLSPSRGLFHHTGLRFLRYPLLQSDVNATSIDNLHWTRIVLPTINSTINRSVYLSRPCRKAAAAR